MKILFVCTGNIFRSMIAEKCLKQYVKQKNISNIVVDSAGIAPLPQKPQKAVIERLKFYGINYNHKYKKINKKLINDNDLIIAMGINHQEFIRKKFGINVQLFNEIVFNKHKSILDFPEYNPQIDKLKRKIKKREIKKYAYFMVDYIHNSIQLLMANILKEG